jgi:hypothetical protein
MALAQRHRIPADWESFATLAEQEGWSDGLPLVPPTEERLAAYLEAAGADPTEVVVDALPPRGAACSTEQLAVNAVMTGAPPAALPLLRAALRAMAEPAFDLHALNATTGSVVPALVVNGPVRHRLDIPYGAGCLGGAGGGAPAIGRALRLVMRNVAGQRIGETSQSVFGTPGRVAGIVFGEWEERSPWAPLAQRRGVTGDALTAYGAMGTMNVCDLASTNGLELLEIIGKSAASPGANGFLTATAFSEVLIAVNPVWAEIIARDVPDAADVQRLLWQHASLPLDWLPAPHRAAIEALDRVGPDGRVHLTPSPDEVLFLTAGGLGNLHAAVLHSWGATRAQTAAIT